MQDTAVKIACCTTPNDRPFLEQLKNRLAPLRQTGEISLFIDIDISSMQAQNQWTLKPLEVAHVILFMISPEALATPFMTSTNMQQLFQRHSNGLVRLIFILTQPALLKGSSFALLPTLPSNKQAITTWPDQEAAYSNVVSGLITHLQSLTGRNMAAGTRSQTETTAPGQEYIGTTPARSFDPAGYRAEERSYQAERYAEVSPEYGQESNNTQFDLWRNGEVIPPPPPGQEAFAEAGRQAFAEQERRKFVPYPGTRYGNIGGRLTSITGAILKDLLYFAGVLIAEFGFITTPLYVGAFLSGVDDPAKSSLANILVHCG